MFTENCKGKNTVVYSMIVCGIKMYNKDECGQKNNIQQANCYIHNDKFNRLRPFLMDENTENIFYRFFQPCIVFKLTTGTEFYKESKQ